MLKLSQFAMSAVIASRAAIEGFAAKGEDVDWITANARPTDRQSPLMPCCKHITAKHREYRNRVKFPSSHAEMIADQTDSKAYTNRPDSAALAGANDVVFDQSCRFLPHRIQHSSSTTTLE
jgi:hypothetical protein